MKWLPLKMNFLPLIFQEINFVTEDYLNLLNKLRQKEKEKPKEEKNYKINDENDSKKSNQNQEKTESDLEKNNNEEKEKETIELDEFELIVKKYNALRESIGKRINELENFYEENIEDVRVSNIEKARLRLKKLLMYNYETITKIENSSQQKNIFIKDTNNLFNKKITEETKKKILENNISLDKQLIKERNKEEEKAKQKLIGSEEKQKKYKLRKSGKSANKKVFKVRGDEGFLRPTDRSNRRSGNLKDGENFDKLENDEYSRFREIVFKIKLNQDEYKILLKEKKNKGHISPYLFK